MKLSRKFAFGCCIAFLYMVACTGNTLAASVIWADDFTHLQIPTNEQCQKWHDFLDQLSPGAEFTSVTMKGSGDPVGITMTDPAAIAELAYLLYTRTDGSVTSEGHTWYVYIGCNYTTCTRAGRGVELGIDTGDGCLCLSSPSYTVRPDIGTANWGGVNTDSCKAESQTMMIEFSQNSDSDDDGIADEEDLCPETNLSQTVAVEGCDSGVSNTLFSDGCTISDAIDACEANARNHGQFAKCVSDELYEMRIEGFLSGKSKGAIQKCVAKSRSRR